MKRNTFVFLKLEMVLFTIRKAFLTFSICQSIDRFSKINTYLLAKVLYLLGFMKIGKSIDKKKKFHSESNFKLFELSFLKLNFYCSIHAILKCVD